ncbi:MAG: grasp-with-spasm system ATP-grasp peptide maturase [Prevotellaceae bacterium]|jgi:ATP-GRASP peptide maturase of grasp-with-spasm system|nr:grasp-with-spasm system ATP-grasp peptide maturase [Prevotellaceae bacterium]
MILILSDEFDQSTNDVIDWLLYFKKPFIRINDTDICEIIKIQFEENKTKIVIKVKNRKIDFDDVSTYWYRRGYFNIKIPVIKKEDIPLLYDEVNNSLKKELYIIVNFLHVYLQDKYGLGSFLDNRINKLQTLILARECGLTIPDTIISSQKNIIKQFQKDKISIITKAISETIMFMVQNVGTILSYTNVVEKHEIDDYNTLIFPSLFQSKIDKKYELRIFYLDGDFYAMAIFSQTNDKTKIDFRNYDNIKPNRCIPYKIPTKIKNKLYNFMKETGFKTGSIDMIVNNRNEYIFLEVNPIGQYGMTSIPCNYYLDKKIAKYLCQIKTTK